MKHKIRQFSKIFSTHLLCGIILILIIGNTNSLAQNELSSKLKTSLNAFSFNAPLMKGEMSMDDLLEYCASRDFDAVDITAYYIPGYPVVPSDEVLYSIKQKAFLLGLEISGTGVRNDFTDPDPEKRRASVELVKQWIVAAEKLGAPVIRVFTGHADTKSLTRDQVLEYLIKDLKECVEFGKAHGVVVGIQNHDDFIKTADQAIEILKLINSDWCGLILDTGSYRTGDPYQEIAQSIPYTVNWQVKENLFVRGVEEKADLPRLIQIIKKFGYRGYIPLETLGEGDPVEKVDRFFKEVKELL